MNLTDALRDSLRHLGDEFKPDRLAYLSLTSKNEQPLCGALAYRLHEKFLGDPNVTIVREWYSKENRRRIDIAVLQSDEAKILIEAKAAMAFDPLIRVKGTRVYPSKDVAKDAEKLRNIKVADQRFLLAFFTTYDGLPKEEDHRAIKYIYGIKGHLKRDKDPKGSFQKDGLPNFRKNVCSLDRCIKHIGSGEIQAGKAFGVNVSVCWELMEAEMNASGLK